MPTTEPVELTKPQVGVLPDFLGSTTLVILASQSGFAKLANSMTSQPLSGEANIEQAFDVVIAIGGQQISVDNAADGSCVIEKAPNRYVWLLSEASRGEIQQQLLTLANSKSTGSHHYLETKGDIQIIASQGEYSSEVFTRDLRLYGISQDFLSGKVFTRKQWTQSRENWTHDHCPFCHAEFNDRTDAPPPVERIGWTDEEEYSWICDRCFNDFRQQFGWKVE